MNALDAVAVSMLPVSRLRAAAAFKDIRHRTDLDRDGLLEGILAACDIPEGDRAAAIALARERAQAAVAAAGTAAIGLVAWNDDSFPALLACTVDPPSVLWTRGQTSALGLPTVAVVGSRAATPYAIDVAYRLSGELADRGIAVASGLARGVDSAAHRGCVDRGGTTAAVLGSGLDRVYPAEHAPLVERIVEKGIVISELGVGAAPLAEHFPLRNRIISGISLAVVVVEASEKSGSLITARCALEQGREVMAVPGSVLSGRNRGSHSLLKDGAKVVESADDILDGLGWPVAPPASIPAPKCLQQDNLLASMELGEVYRLDDLVERTGFSGPKLLTRLMELELAGLVSNTGSGFARRLVT
jgi:DNA processing protein